MGWWRRFRGMSDARRARLVAYGLGGAIILFLYALGGVSLFVRERFLDSEDVLGLQAPVMAQEPEGAPSGDGDGLVVLATPTAELPQPAGALFSSPRGGGTVPSP